MVRKQETATGEQRGRTGTDTPENVAGWRGQDGTIGRNGGHTCEADLVNKPPCAAPHARATDVRAVVGRAWTK